MGKKLSKTWGKGYNTVKRSVKATMVDFETAITAFKAAPEEESEDDDDSDSDASEAPAAKQDSSDSDSSDSDSSDSESSSGDEAVAKKPAAVAQKVAKAQYDSDSEFSDWPTSSDEDS